MEPQRSEQPKRRQLLTAEEREELHFLSHLNKQDWDMLAGTLDYSDLLNIQELINRYLEEYSDSWIEENGTPDADRILAKIMKK